MSRKTAIAASAALVLVLAAGPAPAIAATSAPVGPVVTSPVGGAGDVQPAAVWTWLCQAFGGCK